MGFRARAGHLERRMDQQWLEVVTPNNLIVLEVVGSGKKIIREFFSKSCLASLDG
jgi:hypothetical protein